MGKNFPHAFGVTSEADDKSAEHQRGKAPMESPNDNWGDVKIPSTPFKISQNSLLAAFRFYGIIQF